MIEILCITLRTLNYGNYGIFLIMGNAGFISSGVGVVLFASAVVLNIPPSTCRLEHFVMLYMDAVKVLRSLSVVRSCECACIAYTHVYVLLHTCSNVYGCTYTYLCMYT